MSWQIDVLHSQIEFSAKHMMFTTVRGRFNTFSGTLNINEADPTQSSAEGEIEAASVDTGDPKRDAHLRSADFFDVENYPHIKVKTKRIEVAGENRYKVAADVTIKDVTREIVLDVTTQSLGKDPWGNLRQGFSAEATINRKDFGLNWKVVHTPFDTDAVPLKANEVLVKNLYLSIDPYHRFGLYDPAITQSQFPATKPGTIISTYGISEVVRSNNVDFAPGEILYSWIRWEKFTVVDQSNLQYLQKVNHDLDPVYYLGPLGTPGLTGYAGITEVAKPKQGETIVVSATTGAVGMVAAQVAKRLGLTVVGMASSDDKVRYLVDELGLDSAFNYRTVRSLDNALKEHCPNGIDIFFDLVGGEILDAALPLMKPGGRIPSAGMISQYNLPHDKRYGVKNLHSIVGMNITLQSYRNTTYEHLLVEMQERLGGWLMEGSMKFKMHIAEGLENLPTAFGGIFSGENFGKTVVKVS